MTDHYLHLVSFNVPYPPNYGGVIDVFYKVKALAHIGVKINLHCFDYGRSIQPELNKYCSNVFYYKRKTGLAKSISKFPYIVNSRSNAELLNNLMSDDYPVLLEGLHSTYFLPQLKDNGKLVVVRAHNVEHDYYNYLAKQEHNYLRQLYFKNASKKLQRYEKIMAKADLIAAISPNDLHYFIQAYNNAFWLPPFHPNSEIKIPLGKGKYSIYHGNLSVPENIKAALYIIEVFKNYPHIKIKIAGKTPDDKVIQAASIFDHIEVISSPSNTVMSNLIEEAHIQLLPTFQPTGIKLKLIASLFTGRHCLVNNDMVSGTGLEKLCHKANSMQEFVQQTERLLSIPFEDQDLLLRKEVLSKKFDNIRNAELLVSKIFI